MRKIAFEAAFHSTRKRLEDLSRIVAGLPGKSRGALQKNLDEIASSLDGLRASGEKLAAQAEDRFRSIAAGTPDHLLVMSEDLRYTFVANPQMGLTERDMIGKTDYDILSRDDADKLTAIKRGVLDSGQTVRLETSIASPRGEIEYFEGAYVPKRDPAGRVDGLIGYFRNVTLQKKAEAEIRRQQATLEAINRIFREAIFSETEENLGRICLSEAVNLTGSRLGFIGVINDKGRLDTISINDFARAACRIAGPLGHGKFPVDVKITGLFGRVLADGKSLLSNEPAAHRDSIGIPPGHPPLTSFLGVPLLREGRCIGMIGLGNREGGYRDEDLKIIENLAPAVAQTLLWKKAEEALRESEARFRLALRNAPVSVASQDRDLRFLWAYNQRTIRPAEVIGKSDSDIFAPEDAAKLAALKREVMETGRDLRETLWLTSNGRRVFLDLFLEPLKNAAGEITGVGVATVDLTSMKSAEDALRESEKRYRDLVEMSPDAVFINRDNRITYVNPAALRLFGTAAPDALLGKSPYDLFHPEYHPLMRERIRTVLSGGRAPLIEGRIVRLDGTIRDAEIAAGRFVDKDGPAIQVILRDISARAALEAEMRLLTVALQSAANGIVITAADGTIQWVNTAFTGLTGYDAAEAIGQNPRVLKSGRHQDGFYKTMWETISQGGVWHGELVNKRKDGSFYDEEMTITPVRDAGGKIRNYIAIKQDISERTLAEEDLRRLNRTLEALSESDQALVRARDEAEYLKDVCRIVVEDCGHAMIWIGYAENDKKKSVRPVAWSGFEDGYLETLNISWADNARGRGPTGTAIRTGKPATCLNMQTDPKFAPWRNEAIRRGYASSLVLPLMSREKAFGAVSIYSREPEAFSKDETALLLKLADDLAFGITSIRNRQAHENAADALRQSEERYRSLFNGMTEGFALHEIICDPAGRPVDFRFLDINPAFEKLTGLKREEVVGRTHNEVLPGDDPRWVEDYGAVALTGAPVHFDNYSPALQRHYEVFAYRPAPGQFAVIFMDVTARKLIEEELQKSRELLELRVRERTADIRRQAELLDLSHDAIIVRAMDGRIRFWNRGAEKMYGWAREEALGRITHDLLHTRWPVAFEDVQARLLSEGRWEGELAHTRRDGKPCLVFSRLVLRAAESGDLPEILEINHDITERRRAEERIRQWQKMEALGTLAGGIAHDFNNILAPILINTELALFDADDRAPTAGYLGLVLEAANRGRDMVRQIIAFSRQKELRREPLEIGRVVEEALKLLRSSVPSSIEIREAIDPGAGIVRGDPTQIHQIILNLGSNAAYAMREKGGRMEVGVAPLEVDAEAAARIGDLKPGPHVRLTFSDTGSGMSREVREKAFDPFFTTKKTGEGTGLGLSVVLGIIKSHGGAVAVSSEVGRGTTFDIYFPRGSGEPSTESSSAAEPLPRGEGRILFVDDEDMLVRTMTSMLERLGYTVTGMRDPEEALAAFRARPEAFDLVITDQTMPKMTGEMLARELLRVRADIPIILCTGYSDRIQDDEAKALGIRDFVLKPCSIREMTAKIQAILKKT